MSKRFVTERFSPVSSVWRVKDTTLNGLPPWLFGRHPDEESNRMKAEAAAEILNRGCRAEAEDECLR